MKAGEDWAACRNRTVDQQNTGLRTLEAPRGAKSWARGQRNHQARLAGVGGWPGAGKPGSLEGRLRSFGPMHGRQASGQLGKPKKLRPKLTGLQDMNDAHRTIQTTELKGQSTKGGLKISGQPLPATQHHGQHPSAGEAAYRVWASPVQLADQGTPQLAQEIKQKFLPQLGRAKKPAQSRQKLLLDPNPTSIATDGGATATAFDDSRHPLDSLHGRITPLSMSLKTAREEQVTATKSRLSRNRLAGAGGSAHYHELASLQHTPAMHGSQGTSLVGDDGGAAKLMNFTLMEKLSKTYKATGKYDVQAVSQTTAQEQARNIKLAVKNRAKGTTAQRMQSQGTPSVPPSLVGSPDPPKLTSELLSSKVSTLNKQRLKRIDDGSQRRTALYPKIYFNKNLTQKAAMRSQPNHEALIRAADEGSQATCDRTGTRMDRQPGSPDQGSYMHHPSLTMTKYTTTVYNNSEWKEGSRLMNMQDKDIQQLQRSYKHGFHQVEKQPSLRSQLAKAKHSMSLNRQAQQRQLRELQKHRNRQSILAKQRSRSTLEQVGPEQVTLLHRTLQHASRPNGLVSLSKNVRVHDSRVEKTNHLSDGDPTARQSQQRSSVPEVGPTNQASITDEDGALCYDSYDEQNLDIQAQQFMVASFQGTPMDHIPSPAQMNRLLAPIRQNDYNAFLMKNQDSIRALQTLQGRRTRNRSSSNPKSNGDGVTYGPSPDRQGSDDDFAHHRNITLSNNNINWPMAAAGNQMIFNHSSLYVSPRRPLSDCNSDPKEIDMRPLEGKKPAVVDSKHRLYGATMLSSLKKLEPGACSKSQVARDSLVQRSSTLEQQDKQNIAGQQHGDDLPLHQASNHSGHPTSTRPPFIQHPMSLFDQPPTYSHVNDHSSLRRDILSNNSITTQMAENQENLPRLQRLAQIDYVMSRIGSQFKVEVLNKYGLTQSGYGALFNSRDSLNSMQSLEREKNQALSPLNLMFGQDVEGIRNVKYNIQSHPDNLNDSSVRAEDQGGRAYILDSARSGDSTVRMGRSAERAMQGPINVVSQQSSSNVMNIVEAGSIKKVAESRTEIMRDTQRKGRAAPKKFDPFEKREVTDRDREFLPPDMLQQIDKDNEQNISNEKKQRVWEACHFIDNMLKEREEKAKEKRRMYQDPDIFKDRDEEMDEILGESALPSSLERHRVRKLKEFKEQLTIKQNEIIKIQQTETAGLHSKTKALEVFRKLMDKDLDPEVNKTIRKVDPETAAFLGKIINDVHSTSERTEVAKKLQDDLTKMVFQQMQFDMQIKHRIAVRKRKQQAKVLKDIMNKMKGRTTMKITPTIKKLQDAVNANLMPEPPKPEPRQGVDLSKLLFGNKVQHRKKPKVKNRLQKLVKKHFFNKGKNKLDLVFVTKLARLQEQFEYIFQNGNLGEKYDRLKTNMWANEYLRDVRGKLQDLNVEFDINFEKSQLGLMNFGALFNDEVLKMRFYKQAKDFVHIDETETDKEKIANQNYFKTCAKQQEAPLPAFARLYGHCLFLTECRVSATMAQALGEYLNATKYHPQKITKQLFIDDCGMTDGSFAQILQGLENQGTKIKQIVYSNNDMSYKSVDVLLRLIPHLRELNFNNITRSYGKPMFNQIVERCLTSGVQLQRLKLSNVNLNDNQIVHNLCDLLQQRPFLISLDVSWARLSSKQLDQIMGVLAEKNEHTLRNLNISYNSLTQPPKDENAYFDENDPNYIASEDFIESLCEFMAKNDLLYHLDLSGMNLADEQIIQISQTATMCEGLIALHMSDNGIRAEKELLGEVLDLFGLSEDIFKDHEYRVNNPVSNPQELRNIIKKYTMMLNADQVLNQSKVIDANAYKKHLLQQKQGKIVSNKRIINLAQTSTGIGRTETSLMDDFVLQRQLNQPELIFNQCRYKDCYFEEDSSENWHLQDGACGMSGGCPVCRKHKYTLIFYQQEPSEIAVSKNEGLIEIKDKAVVEQIKEELNLLHEEEQEITPIICGTVVNGSFQRKLRMLRADFFCMLAVCHSANFVTDFKQIKKIKTGILANVLKSQDLNGKDESIEYLKGWHRQLLVDKCSNNETTDMAVINMPRFRDHVKALRLQAQASEAADSPAKAPEVEVDENCKTFVYAAYLCPGMHQFIIYCPRTQRAFCKDVVIDLNSCDCYPEYPEPLRPPKDLPKPKKITRSNVWRKWREDSEEDVQMAFLADCSDSFEPELFIKDADDVEECKRILHDNFEYIKIAYIEGLAGSPATYPEIGFECFIKAMLDQQRTEQEQKRLTRAHMELAYIRATRGDDAHGIQGTLCRGELLETLLRLCTIRHPRSVVSEYLDDFLFIYIKQQYDDSRIIPIRKEIRASKKLNQLLHDNKDGLFQLYLENKADRGFTLESAKALLNPLSPAKGEPLILTLREQFVYSKMTNLKDLQESSKYHYLAYVEFLEFICRVAKVFWEPIRARDSSAAPPVDIEDTVFGLLELMWARRMKNKPKTEGAQKKKSKKKAAFPELVPCVPEDEDSD